MSIVLQHIDTDGEVIIYNPSSGLDSTNTDIDNGIDIHDSLIHVDEKNDETYTKHSRHLSRNHYKLHDRLRDGEHDRYMNEKDTKHNTNDEGDNNRDDSENNNYNNDDNNNDSIIDIYDDDDRDNDDSGGDGDDESYVYDNTENTDNTEVDTDTDIDISYTGGTGQLLLTNLEVDDLILY